MRFPLLNKANGRYSAIGFIWLYSSCFKLHVLRLRSFSPVTYLCKLLGIHLLSDFLQLELFRVYDISTHS